MWNSQQATAIDGKRYTLKELAASIHPLDLLLDMLTSARVSDVVNEPMLQRMEAPELVYALYEVLHALLDDVPVPAGGHPGYHEAIIAELLEQTYGMIEGELTDPESIGFARHAAWTSFKRLAIKRGNDGEPGHGLLDGLPLVVTDPDAHLAECLTREAWSDMLVHDGGLRNEFLHDEDWRSDQLMDADPLVAEKIAELTGIDLQVLHKLPHTPSTAEVRMATDYLRAVIKQYDSAADPFDDNEDDDTAGEAWSR